MDIEYSMGDFVFLKASPWKKVLRFGSKDLKRMDIEYSMGDFVFLKYRSNLSYVVSVDEIEVRQDLTFEEEPVQILDRDVKILKRKSISLVKFLLRNHDTEEAMGEPEDSTRFVYVEEVFYEATYRRYIGSLSA
ncbi:uncharacterized protein LOC128033922 [Gossypium raimondii]|uniref:uncharacterized protein LOC128033922 n=1 Tax=Gossypium raimondii TaxID=29730 RepID=UPI00227BDD01|nr:uncharacterized protein LOC128033922 [Gossypium raimondii]